MQRLTGMEWLKKHISKLEVTSSKFNEEITNIIKINSGIYNKFHPWTPLKLVLLNYALDTCTTIVRKRKFFHNKYYVDLFAGSGLNRISKTNDFFVGSPLVASLNYSEEYTSMFFCENKSDFAEALESRLKFLRKNKFSVEKIDCNLYLNKILNILNEPNSYSFVFIDPYYTEFSWDSMKKILKLKRGNFIGRDIIFTFMSNNLQRYVGLAKKGKSKGLELTKFFGDESWKKADSIDELVEIYKQNILKEKPDTVVRTIKVQSKKRGFCYHLFFITNKTKGKNPWLKSIDKAKSEIESNSDKSVEMALDLIKKRQMDLSTFQKSKV